MNDSQDMQQILAQCSSTQSTEVRRFAANGWEIKGIKNGKVLAVKGFSRKRIDEAGRAYEACVVVGHQPSVRLV